MANPARQMHKPRQVPGEFPSHVGKGRLIYGRRPMEQRFTCQAGVLYDCAKMCSRPGVTIPGRQGECRVQKSAPGTGENGPLPTTKDSSSATDRVDNTTGLISKFFVLIFYSIHMRWIKFDYTKLLYIHPGAYKPHLHNVATWLCRCPFCKKKPTFFLAYYFNHV